MRVLGGAALLMLATAPVARAACPSQDGPWPASFRYDVTSGAHVASASALIPFPLDVVAPIASAVEARPTWPDTGDPRAMPVALEPMLADEHLKESVLEVVAAQDAECPGAARVTSTFRWRFGPMARLFGGEAKDMPALVVLATRDEAIARVLAKTGPAGGRRLVPADLDLEDEQAAGLIARLKEAAAARDVEVAELLAIFFDVQRAGTAITGFRRMPAGDTAAKPESVATSGPRDIGYNLALTKAGESLSLSFGFSTPQ